MDFKLLKTLKILIVEDESTIAKLLQDALKEYFASVAIASNGIEGFEKYKLIKPDIVITDIMMPKNDGLSMTQNIKKYNKETLIIVLSAYSDKQKLLKAIDLGINKYFIKPFDPGEVIEYIRSIANEITKKRKIRLSQEYIFDTKSNSLYKNGVFIKLTKREKEFFYLLIRNLNSVVKNCEIKKYLWSEEEVSDERLRTFIKRLRKKTSKELVQNSSAQGYLVSPLYF
ncbi:MAG: response regulator transcription factor [Campylobacterota bacterium]